MNFRRVKLDNKGCLNASRRTQEPEEILESSEEFFSEQDPVATYIKECVTSDFGLDTKPSIIFLRISDITISKSKFSKI
jgi:hypothetical protein